MRKKALILNMPFVASLFLLIINDHFLKWEYGNWITGKLSDFAGLVILPLLIAYIFPKISRWSIYIAAAVFTWWKSPFSEPLITAYNGIAIIPVTRIVDYTDLIAIAILPLAELIRRNPDKFLRSHLRPANPALLVVIASISCMATSPPPSYYTRPRGDIFIGEKLKLKMHPDEVLRELRNEGFIVENDTAMIGDSTNSYPYYYPAYVIRNIIVEPGDTIKELHFQLNERSDATLVFLNSVTVTNVTGLNHWRILRRYSRHYRKYVKRYVVGNGNRK